MRADLGVVFGGQRPRPLHRLALVRVVRDLQARDEPQRGDDSRDVLRESLDAVEGGECLDWHLASAVGASVRLHKSVTPQIGVGKVEGELLNQGLAGFAGWLHWRGQSARCSGEVFGDTI